MVVAFDQDYRSDSLSQRLRKRQYWTLEDGRWRIAYEAPLRRTGPTLPESYPQDGYAGGVAIPLGRASSRYLRAAASLRAAAISLSAVCNMASNPRSASIV